MFFDSLNSFPFILSSEDDFSLKISSYKECLTLIENSNLNSIEKFVVINYLQFLFGDFFIQEIKRSLSDARIRPF